ncbi:conserved hypothetical protein [Paecilomyces variotii No. 5]|uniref:RRM domain-containing protein n=1 Tax=Byssochlamys spectabilis (strain No. 5 / NBRC 109023) TaxID=1356009 RepID=V5FES6_BYSSN|nr:conserved hypothetical protein [Paecilomyces variotii No. 5]
MVAGKSAAISFDEIIKADRQKRKNEALANEILGKNRRASAPGAGVASKKQTAASGSLASRIGVAKRSASTSFKPKQNTVRQATVNKRRPNDDRLVAALQPENGQATVRGSGIGISIKGAGSGPFVVIGSNFAPGTTAADIQSALEPVAGAMVSCKVVSTYPAVSAEMAFAERQGAETVVANFHNQRADGRVLSMQLKTTGGFNPPTEPRAFSNQNSYEGFREQADRARRENRKADLIQDGTHGFNEQDTRRRRNIRGNNRGGKRQGQDSGLYSDEMMVDAPAQGSRGRNAR